MNRRSKKHVTSLWAVVDAMQRRLENQGLSGEVVDVAVTQRIKSALMGTGPGHGPLNFSPNKA